jgi:hypothetical protein
VVIEVVPFGWLVLAVVRAEVAVVGLLAVPEVPAAVRVEWRPDLGSLVLGAVLPELY